MHASTKRAGRKHRTSFVVVLRVDDAPAPLKVLRCRKALLVETLVVRAARRCVARLDLWRVRVEQRHPEVGQEDVGISVREAALDPFAFPSVAAHPKTPNVSSTPRRAMLPDDNCWHKQVSRFLLDRMPPQHQKKYKKKNV